MASDYRHGEKLEKMTRIYLSKGAKKGLYFFVGLIVLIIIGVISYYLHFGYEDAAVIFGGIFCVSLVIALIVLLRRTYAYVIADNNLLHGYSFYNKEQCTVDMEKEVYYAIFGNTQGGKVNQFIALSNEHFEYQDTYGKNSIKFIQDYDTKKVLVLPCNNYTLSLLNLDEWHSETTMPLLEARQWINVNPVMTAKPEMAISPYLLIGVPSILGFIANDNLEIVFLILFVLATVFMWRNEGRKFAQYYKSKYPIDYTLKRALGGYKELLEFKPEIPDEILEKNQQEFRVLLWYLRIAPICFVICIIVKWFVL